MSIVTVVGVGAIGGVGARHGIETPLNRAMTALLTAIHQET